MTDFSRVLQQLRTDKTQKEQQLKRLDQAIDALQKIAGETSGFPRAKTKRGARKISKMARKRMADAQKARWAKVRQQQKAA